ncbi:UNVERIFIED_ORG: hypothetical protein ABID57_001317 [Arthrobacter sp. UYEF1]
MTAPKAIAATKTAAKKPAAEPGPKPEYQVVETNLHCKTLDGEISLSLLVPYQKIKLIMSMDDVEEKDVIDFVLDELMSTEDADKLKQLRDGTETMKIAMRFMEAVGERLGMSVEKSGGSSAS